MADNLNGVQPEVIAMKTIELCRRSTPCVAENYKPTSAAFARRTWFALFASFALTSSALACGGYGVGDLQSLARDAISAEAAVSAPAIATLRDQGPQGLEALFRAHEEMIKRHLSASAGLATATTDDAWLRVKQALDAVSQQRDCYASRLYWFTDLDRARAAAAANGKPILSLRLLGRLDEEFSCANSRFFRTTLYANADVSRYLREHFILHWKSVRPVPRVTIDFGDGRKLERTITGNSIHYVLDAQGRVIDALPGLYGPQAFLRGIKRAEEITTQCVAFSRREREMEMDALLACGGSQAFTEKAALSRNEREQLLREYHRSRFAAIQADWASDLARIGSAPAILAINNPTGSLFPPAQAAGRVAVSKFATEAPLLRGTAPRGSSSFPALPMETDDATWAKVAALHAETARLDEGSRALIRAKNPNAAEASRTTTSKRRVEDPLLRAMRNLERSMAEDTVRNEYLYHYRIHQWLANGLPADDVERLNSKVYAELFLTPDSDPWLGLVPADTCTALENEGLQTSNR